MPPSPARGMLMWQPLDTMASEAPSHSADLRFCFDKPGGKRGSWSLEDSPGGLPGGAGGTGERTRAPPPSGLQTERGRKASTAAEDNLALSSGAKF